MEKREKLAVLIPCFNEEATIATTLMDYQRVFPQAEIVVCDNASADRTGQIAKEHGVKVILEPRKGKGYAVRSLFTHMDADYFILTDGDHTYRANDAQKLLLLVMNQEADMAVGDRLSSGGYEKSRTRPLHLVGNKLIGKLITWFFGRRIQDPLSGLRVFNRKFVKTIPLISRGFEIETELTLQALDKGFSLREVGIAYADRPANNPSKLNTLSDGFKIILTFFRFAFYFRPVLLTTLVSSLSMFMSFILGLAPVLEYFQYQYVYKVPSLIVATGFFLMAIFAFFVGLILESLRYSRMENFLLLLNDVQSRERK